MARKSMHNKVFTDLPIGTVIDYQEIPDDDLFATPHIALRFQGMWYREPKMDWCAQHLHPPKREWDPAKKRSMKDALDFVWVYHYTVKALGCTQGGVYAVQPDGTCSYININLDSLEASIRRTLSLKGR